MSRPTWRSWQKLTERWESWHLSIAATAGAALAVPFAIAAGVGRVDEVRDWLPPLTSAALAVSGVGVAVVLALPFRPAMSRHWRIYGLRAFLVGLLPVSAVIVTVVWDVTAPPPLGGYVWLIGGAAVVGFLLGATLALPVMLGLWRLDIAARSDAEDPIE